MTYSIFKSVKLINPATNFNQKTNVVIQNDKIIKISKDFNLEQFKKDKQTIIYDCDGLTISPGIFDMRVNIGKTENLKFTQITAAESGITSMAILPNQTPKLNNPSIIDHIKRQSEDINLPKVMVYGAATKNLNSLERICFSQLVKMV